MTEMHANDAAPVPTEDDLRRGDADAARERVEWCAYDEKTGRILRTVKSSRQNMLLHNTPGEKQMETTGLGVRVTSHQVNLSTGDLEPFVETLEEAKQRKAREIDHAFHAEIEASWRSAAHSVSANPTDDHQLRVRAARQRLADIKMALESAETAVAVSALGWAPLQ